MKERSIKHRIASQSLAMTVLILCFHFNLQSQKLTEVKSFGDNPGNLKMYMYSPASLSADKKVPLVVVLHGCLQSAGVVAKQSGWNKLADEYGFKVLYPQQRMLNNPTKCFCWYKRSDIEKGKGEALSVKQMIDEVKRTNNIDTSKVFITWLSAGAAMSVVHRSLSCSRPLCLCAWRKRAYLHCRMQKNGKQR